MVKWLDDSLCRQCYKCNTLFTFFTRKHHCRLCGLIFCYKCIKNKQITINYNTKVCLLCINKEKKQYISYLLEELNKKDYTIQYLKNIIYELKENKHSKSNKTISSYTNENTIQEENKFNIAEYLQNLK